MGEKLELLEDSSLEDGSVEPLGRGERPVYPCRSGTPKRSRFKKGHKRMRQNGKHRRRAKKITW